MQRGALLLMLEEALVRPWMALMTLMAGVRTPSPMIMDVASSTTVSNRPRATLLCLSNAPACRRRDSCQTDARHERNPH